MFNVYVAPLVLLVLVSMMLFKDIDSDLAIFLPQWVQLLPRFFSARIRELCDVLAPSEMAFR